MVGIGDVTGYGHRLRALRAQLGTDTLKQFRATRSKYKSATLLGESRGEDNAKSA